MKGLLCFLLAIPTIAFAQKGKVDELKLEDLYPEKSPMGKTARGMSWSYDDRYVAYLWNPYDDRGNDLWIFDTVSKKSTRLTSIEMFSKFDRETKVTMERYAREKEDENKKRGLSGDDLKKFEEDIRKRKEK
ncbi:MAG TPA: hypothetical protein PKA27_04140, partial [Fimbriimonadaceae bacterium]|nr:hypothetical protein [Fimbriimonadaceae bacterium]